MPTYQFTVVIEPDEDAFHAFVPALPSEGGRFSTRNNTKKLHAICRRHTTLTTSPYSFSTSADAIRSLRGTARQRVAIANTSRAMILRQR